MKPVKEGKDGEKKQKTPAIITEDTVNSKKLLQLDLAGMYIQFQRTCRVPEARINDLPAGLGVFPIYSVRDFRSATPKNWNNQDYFVPMYALEAMFLNFPQRNSHQLSNPYALIVAAGSINAVTGEQIKVTNKTLEAALQQKQNYLVVPPQPWLDGWKDAETGKVFQFVAAELGSGQTVEGQITGEEKVGGLQLLVYKTQRDIKIAESPRDRPLGELGIRFNPSVTDLGYSEGLDGSCAIEELACDIGELYESGELEEIPGTSFFCSSPDSERFCFEDQSPPRQHSYPREMVRGLLSLGTEPSFSRSGRTPTLKSASMPMRTQLKKQMPRKRNAITSLGFGRGGEINQKIYSDPYGYDIWNKEPAAIARVHLVSSEDFMQITGVNPPPTSVTYEQYKRLGIPMFRLEDVKYQDTQGSKIFSGLKTVGDGKK